MGTVVNTACPMRGASLKIFEVVSSKEPDGTLSETGTIESWALTFSNPSVKTLTEVLLSKAFSAHIVLYTSTSETQLTWMFSEPFKGNGLGTSLSETLLTSPFLEPFKANEFGTSFSEILPTTAVLESNKANKLGTSFENLLTSPFSGPLEANERIISFSETRLARVFSEPFKEAVLETSFSKAPLDPPFSELFKAEAFNTSLSKHLSLELLSEFVKGSDWVSSFSNDLVGGIFSALLKIECLAASFPDVPPVGTFFRLSNDLALLKSTSPVALSDPLKPAMLGIFSSKCSSIGTFREALGDEGLGLSLCTLLLASALSDPLTGDSLAPSLPKLLLTAASSNPFAPVMGSITASPVTLKAELVDTSSTVLEGSLTVALVSFSHGTFWSLAASIGTQGAAPGSMEGDTVDDCNTAFSGVTYASSPDTVCSKDTLSPEISEVSTSPVIWHPFSADSFSNSTPEKSESVVLEIHGRFFLESDFTFTLERCPSAEMFLPFRWYWGGPEDTAFFGFSVEESGTGVDEGNLTGFASFSGSLRSLFRFLNASVDFLPFLPLFCSQALFDFPS